MLLKQSRYRYTGSSLLSLLSGAFAVQYELHTTASIYCDIVYIITDDTEIKRCLRRRTMSKRRCGQDLFSREAVMACLKARSDVKDRINSIANYESAKNLELMQILSDKNEIGEEAMVFILSSKLTTKGLLTLLRQLTTFPHHTVEQVTGTIQI